MGFSYYGTSGDTGKNVLIIILIILLLIAIALAIIFGILMYNQKDSGQIGVNVTTGKCKIDIVDSDGATLVGDVLDFALEGDEDTIYFEPGMLCYTEGFSVKNVGTVKINFHVSVSEDAEIDNEQFKNAFELWITNDVSDLSEATEITSFTGTLSAGEQSETYYLVIRMKDTAGNEFQDQTYTGIGITVHAVQISKDPQ